MTERFNKSPERSPQPEPASLEKIATLANSIAAEIHAAAPIFATRAQESWQKLLSQLTPNGETWNGSLQSMRSFWDEIQAHGELLNTPRIFELCAMTETRGVLHDDWFTLAGFLQHDLYHTSPREIIEIYRNLQNRFIKLGEVKLLNRHKEYLEWAISQAEALAHQFALPLEFLANRTNIEAGIPVPNQETDVESLLTTLGLLITGRFSFEDFNLVINGKPDTTRNNLIIDVPPNLKIDVNPSMLFGIIYNLVKNGAKANASKHYNLGDQALIKGYEGKTLEHPMNLRIEVAERNQFIHISVIDEGEGISLDASLQRFQKQLARRLEEIGPEELKKSEWIRVIKHTLGEEQTNFLLSWPTEPLTLRNVTVGTVFDLHFVAGFEAEGWEIRSLTSGTGLWGVRYIVENLRGSVVGTNSFDGGAVFSVIFPRTAYA